MHQRFHVVKNPGQHAALVREALELKQWSEPLTLLSHSSYMHTKPTAFGKTPKKTWKLLSLYASLAGYLQHELGLADKLFTMPIAMDPRFEINCKLNYYTFRSGGDAKPSQIGWHFDRTDQVRGDVYVAVYTLWNDLPDTVSTNDGEQFGQTLSYLEGDVVHSVRTPSNSLTVHDARRVYHRVNPITLANGSEDKTRCVFVMKYTTDPRPMGIPRRIGQSASFVARSIKAYAVVDDHARAHVALAAGSLSGCFVMVLLLYCIGSPALFTSAK